MVESVGQGARREGRQPLECVLQLSWQVAGTETRTVRAICLDISAQGARIACTQPIAARSCVYLQAPSFGLMGSATVRYCKPRGLKYNVGLEFTWAADLAEAGRKKAFAGA